MAATNKNKHMTENERKIIESSIRNGATHTAIAQVIGKDKSTIGKEIRLHRVLTYKCSLPLECANRSKCSHNHSCKLECPGYIRFKCSRRDRSPGACNGCSKFQSCRFNKYVYQPETAHREYRNTLVDSRAGVNLTTDEAKKMGGIVKPLLDQGQSPYQIIQAHPELGITERTLYTYIETGVFSIVGISVMDLRRQVSRKKFKSKKAALKKREDRRFLKGRTYKDYCNYLSENEDARIVQMDTVYNDISKGPFIQTFKFVKYSFLFGILHDEKTEEAMVSGVNALENLLGSELFHEEVEVLLTDRGSEMADAEGIETKENGVRRTRVYYCDPMQSTQKATLENNHIELRYIFPKETDLRALGLTSQEALNTALSHINSMSKEKLNGKSPIELMEFLHPELMKKFNDFGITRIEKDNIILKPYLLKK